MSSDNLNALKKQLEYNMFVENNYLECQSLLEQYFIYLSKANTNKHNCNRNTNCECISFVQYANDIYLNLNFTDNKFELLLFLEKYFIHPKLNLPSDAIIIIAKSMMKLHLFNQAYTLIDNYITYSNIGLNKQKKGLELKEKDVFLSFYNLVFVYDGDTHI